MQSAHDQEAKRIKQWVEFLIVIFGLATILALVYSDGWVLVPLAAIFAWELWNLHKDAMALDEFSPSPATLPGVARDAADLRARGVPLPCDALVSHRLTPAALQIAPHTKARMMVTAATSSAVSSAVNLSHIAPPYPPSRDAAIIVYLLG